MTDARKEPSLLVNEVFYSLQGEASRVGLPTVFVRLTGCPLRCTWCDTEHAFSGGHRMAIHEIVDKVTEFRTPHVCVTGGEPLAQKHCGSLLSALCDASFDVSLETSGALDISRIDARVSRIVDLKPPGSGESGRNYWANIPVLTPRDEVKFVLSDRTDYEWAKAAVLEHRLDQRCPVLFSPVQGKLSPHDLVDWILSDHLPVRFQLQLHKILWGNMRGK